MTRDLLTRRRLRDRRKIFNYSVFEAIKIFCRKNFECICFCEENFQLVCIGYVNNPFHSRASNIKMLRENNQIRNCLQGMLKRCSRFSSIHLMSHMSSLDFRHYHVVNMICHPTAQLLKHNDSVL